MAVENSKVMNKSRILVVATVILVAVSLSSWNDCLQRNITSYLNSEVKIKQGQGEALASSSLSVAQKKTPPSPFSTLDPVGDLHLYDYDRRPHTTSPGRVFSDLRMGQKYTGQALPTNAWYEDMILLLDGLDPSHEHKVYTIPYMINAIGPIPGINLHSTHVQGEDLSVQVVFNERHGLTLGAAKSVASEDLQSQGTDMGVKRRYEIDHVPGDLPGPLTPLGLTLKWECSSQEQEDDAWMRSSFLKMTSSIVRGMPFGTMHYHYNEHDFGMTLPTVVSQISLADKPFADSNVELICTSESIKGTETLVKSYVELHFDASDYSWLVFYSRPVHVRCYSYPQGDAAFVLQVARLAGKGKAQTEDFIFTSRIALMNNCTRGTNPMHCSGKPNDASGFSRLLKRHAYVYPGEKTNVDHRFVYGKMDGKIDHTLVTFGWDPRRASDTKSVNPGENKGKLLMYALPHHREILQPQTSSAASRDDKFCTPSLNGIACIVFGSSWILKEKMDCETSFWAPRSPTASAIPSLAKAITSDIKFRLPEWYERGAGDTYFSGKMIAKLARILLIYKEVQSICSDPSKQASEYIQPCAEVTLPSADTFNLALDHLRKATQVWIDGTAETPFVFDSKWGGIVSCGCIFNEQSRRCNNVSPECPSFTDPGLDFGHGIYNDHHFHQGYIIYAASAVAYFDEEWGKEQFENVLLLIRDIANPSSDDHFFPLYRMKDWYLGNSWAGGIASSPIGRNQESSSEAIAAYEAVSLYGSVMTDIFSRHSNQSKHSSDIVSRAKNVRDVGHLLTATELRSTDRYWHVRQNGDGKRIYPVQYKPYAVGIFWNTMVQFQTWFGAAPHLAYGIQLLPLTPISEQRDEIGWAKQLYPALAESCHGVQGCDEEGWGILQYAILATVGYPKEAIAYAESLKGDVFNTAGGNGHSLTNTLWYYSTRPETEPLNLTFESQPLTTSPVGQVNEKKEPLSSKCSPCSVLVCAGSLNRCPISAPYLCTDGPAVGGCSPQTWVLNAAVCNSCCLLSHCP